MGFHLSLILSSTVVFHSHSTQNFSMAPYFTQDKSYILKVAYMSLQDLTPPCYCSSLICKHSLAQLYWFLCWSLNMPGMFPSQGFLQHSLY